MCIYIYIFIYIYRHIKPPVAFKTEPLLLVLIPWVLPGGGRKKKEKKREKSKMEGDQGNGCNARTGTGSATGTQAPAPELPGTQLPSCYQILPWPISAPHPKRQNSTLGGSAEAPPRPPPSPLLGIKTRGKRQEQLEAASRIPPQGSSKRCSSMRGVPPALQGPPNPTAGRVGMLRPWQQWWPQLGKQQLAPQLHGVHGAAAPRTC